jgi:DNA polymerase I-like protein with 3'-5' exonuclease and polymerase domains
LPNIQLPFPEFLPNSEWRPPDSFPEISREKWWSIDIEARDPHLTSRGPGYISGDAYVVGIAIATEGFRGYYPVRHAQGCNLAPNVVFPWLQDQVKHFRGELYGGNLLYDEEALWFEDVKFHDDVTRFDIQIAEPIIDEETADGYSVEVLSNKYLGVGKDEELLREAAGRYTKGYKDKRARRPIVFDPKSDLWMMPPEYVGAYGEGDVDRPLRIFRDHQSKIIDKENLWDIFKLETSLIPILLKMRINGVAVDLDKAHGLVEKLTIEIDKLSMEIKRLVGFDPNVDSGKDMLKAYNVLNFKMPELNIANNFKYTAPSEKHPGGQASFTAEWYGAQRDPLSRMVLKKKKLMTLRDDFVIGDIIKESTNGRLHCQFQQLRADDSGTRSGRMASRNPNLQQVPNRHDDELWGKDSPIWAEEIRKLFVADKINPYGSERKKYFKGDYSQQEPRLLVHFASLCKLAGADIAVRAFRANPLVDYHQLTTDIVNEKSGKQFKRKQIKGVNLGIMYSMGIQKLCRMLGVSIQEGQEILNAYHSSLPFVKALSSKAMSTAQDRGFILTLLKRKRRFNLWEPIPESKEERQFKVQGLPRHLAEQRWPGRRLQRYGVHKALNALIQGSAADQTKEAMRVLYYDYGYVPALQVHDELGGSVDDMEQARTIKRVMQECVLLEIPVVCDAKVGPSWGESKEEVLLLAA